MEEEQLAKQIDALNSPHATERRTATCLIADAITAGTIRRTASKEVNNHVHSTYSFSPYSPSSIVFHAWQAGLEAVGIVDHESIAGAQEFLESANSIGIGATVGVELRCSFADTPFSQRNFNNPDTAGIAYMLMHGIPSCSFAALDEFLNPIREARRERSRQEVSKLNALLAETLLPKNNLSLDFDNDVLPLSNWEQGGSLTERHILLALSLKIIDHVGKGAKLISFLQEKLGILLPETLLRYLADENSPHYHYDLLGLLKQQFLHLCYIHPDTECLPVQEVIAVAKELGAIPVYPYLGDVLKFALDKQHTVFEDAYIDELLAYLKGMGIKGIAYMPPRNTSKQLQYLQALCRMHGYMEISGVDINSSRQNFNAPECLQEEFHILIDATWALIAHERLSDIDLRYGIFHEQNPFRCTSLEEKMYTYADIGRKIALLEPDARKTLVARMLE